MGAETFGAAVGRLIRQRRKTHGLTQIQLAEDAYGTSAKTRRISELETGLVANPHATTLDPLIAVLGITTEELEACAAQAPPSIDPDLDRAYREARNLIEAVASQFEFANPDSTLAELEDYLRSKAKEWSALRERIERLDEVDERLAELKSCAIKALDAGDFSSADIALQQAEEFQLNGPALRELGKLVELRMTRGDMKLMANDSASALSIYLSAAEIIKPLSDPQAAELLSEKAHELYEVGRRSLRSHFEVAAKLLQVCLTFDSVKANDRRVAKVSYQISLIFRNESAVTGKHERAGFQDKAIEYARSATSIFSSHELESDEGLYDLVSAEIALGNALFEKSRFRPKEVNIEEVVQMFRVTLNRFGDRPIHYELRGHVANSLGSALMTQLEARKLPLNSASISEIVDAYTQAISAAEKCADAEVWGVAQGNLGAALVRLAAITEDKGEAHFLRIRGISALQAAIETYPTVLFPMPHAQMHLRLGDALVEHGLRCQDALMEFYLLRAIGSYLAAAEIFDEERHPSTWAFIQSEVSRIYFAHSRIADQETAKSDLERSANHIMNAIRVHESLNAEQAVIACRKALKAIEKARVA